MTISSFQLKSARLLLGWSQDRLADAAAASPATICFFETGRRRPRRATIAAIRRALELAGIEFTAGKEGVRLHGPDKTILATWDPPPAVKL